MSQLILLRQRIHAIETIQKITHAMRLIAMSSHTHLKNKQIAFQSYTKNLKHIIAKIKAITVQEHALFNSPASLQKERVLICVLGSQKGLCGTFNSTLVHYVNQHIQHFEAEKVSLFLVGKKVVDALSTPYRQQIIATEPHFSLKTVPHIIAKISSFIESYDRVIIINNVLKSFFSQKPKIHTVIPVEWDHSDATECATTEYQWEVEPQSIFDSLIKEYTHATIEYLLLESLLAEHAARFIAMDNSTRNAHTLLEEKKLEYNKLRQAKITKELTELSGIFTL